MELKINIYGDCVSEEPTKTFTVRRILFKTAKELASLQAESKTAKDEEQEEITYRMLKTVIPNIEKEDIDGIDTLELGEFFKQIGAEISKIVGNAQKN